MVHDPGKILTDLVVALALGGDCLADIAVLRAEPELAGPVASGPVVSRLITALAAEAPRALRAIRGARAGAPRACLGAGRGPGSWGGRVTDPSGHRRHAGDCALGERAGHSDMEEDLWVPSADRIR